MARDLAVSASVLALVFFFVGVAAGTSKGLGMFVAWAIAAILLVIALVAGTRAVLLDRFPSKD